MLTKFTIMLLYPLTYLYLYITYRSAPTLLCYIYMTWNIILEQKTVTTDMRMINKDHLNIIDKTQRKARGDLIGKRCHLVE